MFSTKFLIRILTVLGTIPFFILALNIVLFPQLYVDMSLRLLIIYSSTMMMFIAGMWWGVVDLNFDKPDEAHQDMKGFAVIWSVVSTFFICVTLFIGDSLLSLVTLLFFYIAQTLVESYLKSYNLMSNWLVEMRFKPLVLSALCLLAVLTKQMGLLS